ncbi:membrane protein [Clostridium sp. K25]|uniref:membrane protein insertase YidC n=1 Tax=Clostridium sp. K25 TaxID=1443109 RepID=UPI0004D66066|nr:membrane protein insertase YidC [Clostridium sp. K25]KEI06714.1 membrane protein [Clostridium sp. K25]
MSIILNLFNCLLYYIFSITGDLGIAIIILTVIVRIILLPISIKQKTNMIEHQFLSKRIKELKIKFKDNKRKLELETQKLNKENSKYIIGYFASLIQIPLMYSLYNVIIKMPIEVGTIIIPWVTNIKLTDKYYIVPLIYMLVSISPGLLSYIKALKNFNEVNGILSMISISIISILITIKAPVALGIYFITTGIFSFFEELVFRLYMKNKCLN